MFTVAYDFTKSNKITILFFYHFMLLVLTEWIDYKLALLVYKCRQGVHRRTSPTNSASQQTPRFDVV